MAERCLDGPRPRQASMAIDRTRRALRSSAVCIRLALHSNRRGALRNHVDPRRLVACWLLRSQNLASNVTDLEACLD
eukprot:scaffold69032_cov37-Tisochrysis_lutea.AAC.3